MRLAQEITLGVAALLILQLLTSFAAIALFARMTPAVQEILEANVDSMVASEHLLAAVATEEGAESLYRWVDRARENVTEPAEGPLLDRIEALIPDVAAGAPEAVDAFVANVHALSQVNRDHMARADLAARQRGTAGAWAAALLGMISFTVGIIVHRRLRTRLEVPVLEVDAVLAAGRAGDPHRRAIHRPSAVELHRITENLNGILDQVQRTRGGADDRRLRAALLHLLDERAAPTALIQEKDEVVAMNLAAVTLWDDPKRADQVAQLLSGEPVPGWDAAPLAEGLTLWTRVADRGTTGTTG